MGNNSLQVRIWNMAPCSQSHEEKKLYVDKSGIIQFHKTRYTRRLEAKSTKAKV